MERLELTFIPEKFRINQEIPLDVFCQNAKLSETKKKKFFMYCNEVAVIGKITEEKNEIIILKISIKSKPIDKYDLINFLKSIFEGIPYPIWILLDYKNKSYKFVAAEFHQKQKTYGNIVESLRWSLWIDIDKSYFSDKKLLENINRLLSNFTDINQVYEDFKGILQTHFESLDLGKIEDEAKAFFELSQNYDYIENTFKNM